MASLMEAHLELHKLFLMMKTLPSIYFLGGTSMVEVLI